MHRKGAQVGHFPTITRYMHIETNVHNANMPR